MVGTASSFAGTSSWTLKLAFFSAVSACELANTDLNRMHVFADLRPYICTFARCSKELAQFTTRAAWAEHEFNEHRTVRSWLCPECSLQCHSETDWDEHLEESHQQTFLGLNHEITLKMAGTTQVGLVWSKYIRVWILRPSFPKQEC